jgi:hypothetical protein
MPNNIAVADKSNNLTKSTRKALTDVAKIYGFEYVEPGLRFATPEELSTFHDLPVLPDLENLVLCPMGDAGMGVFAKADIKKRSILCTYAGEYSPNAFSHFGSIEEFRDKIEYTFLIELDDKFYGLANARKKGDVGRFFQHLPTQEELDANYTFTNHVDRNRVATANVGFALGVYNKKLVLCLYALEDIAAGSVLGYSYDQLYWTSHPKNPLLFTHNGTPIPAKLNQVFISFYIADKRFVKESQVNDIRLSLDAIKMFLATNQLYLNISPGPGSKGFYFIRAELEKNIRKKAV